MSAVLACRVPGAAHTDAAADIEAGSAVGIGWPSVATQPEPPPKSKPRLPSHYLWAALIAHIYEVFALICPRCGGPMRIIALTTFSVEIQQILERIGVYTEPPRSTPARGPALWDDCGAQDQGEVSQGEPDRDLSAQPAPDYADDQRTVW